MERRKGTGIRSPPGSRADKPLGQKTEQGPPARRESRAGDGRGGGSATGQPGTNRFRAPVAVALRTPRPSVSGAHGARGP